jgi:hypothetical protein
MHTLRATGRALMALLRQTKEGTARPVPQDAIYQESAGPFAPQPRLCLFNLL